MPRLPTAVRAAAAAGREGGRGRAPEAAGLQGSLAFALRDRGARGGSIDRDGDSPLSLSLLLSLAPLLLVLVLVLLLLLVLLLRRPFSSVAEEALSKASNLAERHDTSFARASICSFDDDVEEEEGAEGGGGAEEGAGRGFG